MAGKKRVSTLDPIKVEPQIDTEEWAEIRMNWRHWTVNGKKIPDALMAQYIGYGQTDQCKQDPGYQKQLAADTQAAAEKGPAIRVTAAAEDRDWQRRMAAIKDGGDIASVPLSDLQAVQKMVEEKPDGTPTGLTCVVLDPREAGFVDTSGFEPVIGGNGQQVNVKGTMVYQMPKDVADAKQRRLQERNHRTYGTSAEDGHRKLEEQMAEEARKSNQRRAQLDSSLQSGEIASQLGRGFSPEEDDAEVGPVGAQRVVVEND
jgi:hypothetical protein